MKKIINILMISAVLISATACSLGTEKSETYTKSEAVVATPITTPTPTPKLPDELYFMTNLDPVKNSDGTYSFKGFFTGCKFSQYSIDPTLYIRTLNGKEFSTGETSMYYALYQNPRTGEYDSVLNGLMNNPSSITGILFEFVYDSDGNFVDLRQ
ncbi:MAG: hypothetical protein IJC09_00860 [Clostridia bacterium]|nr:hypothetical protein [Clostridia bacterium]